MEQTKQEQFIIRRIGGTTYKVRVAFSDTAAETMEEKILRMIRNEGVTIDGTYDIMEAPQINGTGLIISKTNKLRKEEAYGANATGTVHHSAHRRHHL